MEGGEAVAGGDAVTTHDYLMARYPESDTKGVPIELRGGCRDDLPQMFVDIGFTRGAEVGVWRGEYSEKFLKAGLQMTVVDPWQAYSGYIDHTKHHMIAGAYEDAMRRFAPYGDEVRVIRKFSHEAVADVPEGSLDFCYLDGNHSLFDVVRDLTLWSKKVRSGGIICGHDYKSFRQSVHIHVVEAVHAFTAAEGIAPWYVLGRRKRHTTEPGDTVRSFMWVNP